MNKKKIAIICSAVLLVSVLLTVVIVQSQKEIYVDADGYEHWIYRNDYDYTVLNENGDIVVYATDENGRRMKDDSGEYMTAAINFPEMLITDNTLETPDYRMTMPDKWELSEDGEFTLKKNEDVKLNINKIGDIGEKSFNDYFNDRIELYKSLYGEVGSGSEGYTYGIGAATITMKNISCKTVECKQMSDDGSTIENYVFEMFFEHNGMVFQISYVCMNGSFDESIDILELLHSNFTTKLTN